MARTRRRTGNRTFAKRSTLWLPFDVFAELAVAGTVVETGDLLGNYFSQTGEEVPVGSTLGPIRGKWGATPAVVTATGEDVIIEALIQLNREGGRATLPVPGVDITDGMWYGQLLLDWPEWEISSGTFGSRGFHEQLLTNAKRKVVGNGQTLTMSAVSNTSVDYTIRAVGNLMLMLP